METTRVDLGPIKSRSFQQAKLKAREEEGYHQDLTRLVRIETIGTLLITRNVWTDGLKRTIWEVHWGFKVKLWMKCDGTWILNRRCKWKSQNLTENQGRLLLTNDRQSSKSTWSKSQRKSHRIKREIRSKESSV